jgi:hypothetical protein
MRSAILQLPSRRNSNERRQVLRAAIRRLPVDGVSPTGRHGGQGLDRAEIYLAAVAYMDIDDRAAQRSVGQLRSDVDSLKCHLAELRVETKD